ncbi:MAG: hypothetical protein KGL42_08620 [Betaproteobacteria bacterium]|nr:hypothetical protein [Betaproteobacteria bacterium]
MTKERPIIFSAPMVRAILEGHKTQTRRVFKVPRGCSWYEGHGGEAAGMIQDDTGPAWWHVEEQGCPYGEPGSKLWVREAFRFTDVFDQDSPYRVGERCVDAGYRIPWAPLQFEADGRRMNWVHTGTPPHDGPPMPGKLRPAIHMPRWASRITLKVTGVRVERLQEITPADCVEEGCMPTEQRYAQAELQVLDMYKELWEQINGPGSWDANPWVWVIEFRRLA